MSWSDFYLLCFLVGFSLSVLSFLAGAVHIHLPFKMHLPFHGGHHAGGGEGQGFGRARVQVGGGLGARELLADGVEVKGGGHASQFE